MRDEPAYDPEERDTRAAGKRRDVRGIAERVDDLDRVLHLIGQQIERATEQLGPILQPERPSAALGEVRGGDEVESELSARLHRLTTHGDRLARDLRELLDRVDL